MWSGLTIAYPVPPTVWFITMFRICSVFKWQVCSLLANFAGFLSLGAWICCSNPHGSNICFVACIILYHCMTISSWRNTILLVDLYHLVVKYCNRTSPCVDDSPTVLVLLSMGNLKRNPMLIAWHLRVAFIFWNFHSMAAPESIKTLTS